MELEEGPLPDFPHNMEPQLRQLGLPTCLKKGVVTLLSKHTICRAGKPLTPEQARVLKLLGLQVAEFKIKLLARWNAGDVEILAEPSEAAVAGDDDEDGEGVEMDEEAEEN